MALEFNHRPNLSFQVLGSINLVKYWPRRASWLVEQLIRLIIY